MKMADYLKYCQTKLSALEDLAENFDLAKATAIFQGTDAANIIGSGSENPDSSEVPDQGNTTDTASVQGDTVQSGVTPLSASQADNTQNQSSQDSLQCSKSTDEFSLPLDLTGSNLVQGLIMSEILGSPRAKRWRGNTIWNSRF